MQELIRKMRRMDDKAFAYFKLFFDEEVWRRQNLKKAAKEYSKAYKMAKRVA